MCQWPKVPPWYLKRAILSLALSFICPILTRADDEKTTKQLARLDAEFLKALLDLAKKYDRDKIPEAAHFLAGSALGLGLGI